MKKICSIVLLLTLAAFAITGCSATQGGSGEPTEQNVENPFEDTSGQDVVMGSIGHGLRNPALDQNNVRIPLQYNGGEMEIQYAVNASGKGKNVGLFMFIDGIPQSYKIDAATAPEEYLHIFDIEEDNKELPFTFIFAPVTGKHGETATITFVSIYNPRFQPDMIETMSYGGYHQILEFSSKLVFNQDADAPTEQPKRVEAMANETLSYEAVTNDLFDELSGLSVVTQEFFDNNVFSLVYYDGAATKMNNLQIDSQGVLNVTYKLCGAAGANYKTTFYINHQPVAYTDMTVQETGITKGEITVVNADIELDKLGEFNTFYVISVPTNASDYPNANIFAVKTLSMLLYI